MLIVKPFFEVQGFFQKEQNHKKAGEGLPLGMGREEAEATNKKVVGAAWVVGHTCDTI